MPLKNLPYLAKASIIIPIVLLVVGLLVKVAGLRIIAPDPTPTLTPEPTRPQAANAKFNLKGPLVCDLTTKDATLSAWIKDKKILITRRAPHETDSILIRDDCLYVFDVEENTGDQVCGIGKYLSLADQISKYGVFDFQSLLALVDIQNLNTSIISSLTTQQVQDISQSCRKKDILDKTFTIPQSILFKKNSIDTLINEKSTKSGSPL